MGNCWSFQANPKYYPGAVLDAHNYFRAHHLSPPLTLNMELCKEASMQANLCAFYDDIKWSKRDLDKGENIYVDDGNDENLWTACYQAVNSWYETIRYHKFSGTWDDNKDSKALCTMLWKDSRKLGVGFARTATEHNKKRKTYIVCFYEPKANKDRINENVLIPANLLPACAIDLSEKNNEPNKDRHEIYVKELLSGWDNFDAPEWKTGYFSKNPWAKKALDDYIILRRHLLNPQSAGFVKAPEIKPGDPQKLSRRKRAAVTAPKVIGDIETQKSSKPECKTKKNGTIKVFIETRIVSPEIQKRKKGLLATPPSFDYQRYFHNI